MRVYIHLCAATVVMVLIHQEQTALIKGFYSVSGIKISRIGGPRTKLNEKDIGFDSLLTLSSTNGFGPITP